MDDLVQKNSENIQNYLVVAPKTRTEDLVTGMAMLPTMHGKLGLLRICRHPTQRQIRKIPRGFVDPGESERISALRELKEKTGLVFSEADLESLVIITSEPGILAARVHLFTARQCQEVKPFTCEDFGHKEFRFMELAQDGALYEAGEIKDPSTIITYFKNQNTLK